MSDIAPTEMPDACAEAVPECAENADKPKTAPDNVSRPPPTFYKQRQGDERSPQQTLLKRLIALATAQYVLVTLLVGLAAIVIAQQASQAVNAKLSAIIAALKRL